MGNRWNILSKMLKDAAEPRQKVESKVSHKNYPTLFLDSKKVKKGVSVGDSVDIAGTGKVTRVEERESGYGEHVIEIRKIAVGKSKTE